MISSVQLAPHSSTLAWRIPLTEEPVELQSMGSLRVEHDSATSLSLFTFMHWRRQWQPTRVLAWRIPGTGGAWWAAVYGVAQSRTRLKQLSSSGLDMISSVQLCEGGKRSPQLECIGCDSMLTEKQSKSKVITWPPNPWILKWPLNVRAKLLHQQRGVWGLGLGHVSVLQVNLLSLEKWKETFGA